MTSEILDALAVIAKEKGVDPDYLLETLEEGILAAAQRKYKRAPHVEVKINQVSGEISVIVHKRVSAVSWDLMSEIDLEEARQIEPDIREGDVVPVEVSVDEFGRNAISAVKQALVQHVRDAERKNVYDEYVNRVGEIITGTVQQVDRGAIVLRLGKAEAIIPPAENIRRDRPRLGDHIRALLVEVLPTSRGSEPQIILSRTRPEFVVGLFEQEVPEVYERVVEIKGIAREAGARTKIAVVSHDDRVDPVGACVGVKGSRVQNIVKSLGGERIDIVALSSDPLIFVSRALSPARVLSVSFMGDPKIVRAVVPDDQLSLAIGKSAQNVRLAGQLTGLEIQLVSQSQQASLEGRDEGAVLELESLGKELGPKLVERLIRAGKETLQDVLETPVEELMEIQGIGEKTASKLVTIGAQLLEQWDEQRRLAGQQQESEDSPEAPEVSAEEPAAPGQETEALAEGADGSTDDAPLSEDEEAAGGESEPEASSDDGEQKAAGDENSPAAAGDENSPAAAGSEETANTAETGNVSFQTD
ncbi:MAG: transcription termination/antitermination protein NusA, partial [Candidatus Eisenbacteria sp.]|nr:transcription termination/antitermination protein NusA [Candidatus Eisenbacteria bacterium]